MSTETGQEDAAVTAAELARTKYELEIAQLRLRDAYEQIRRMRQSRSWRYTAPLRSLGRLWR
jgi:hypothetical protein